MAIQGNSVLFRPSVSQNIHVKSHLTTGMLVHRHELDAASDLRARTSILLSICNHPPIDGTLSNNDGLADSR